MATTTYGYTFWHSNYPYERYDVVYGANASDTRYYYATAPSMDLQPLSRLSYTPLSATRQDNVVRVTFTQTGTNYFQPGSIVAVADSSPDTSTNYTGVILAGGIVTGSVGYVDYLSPGLNTTNGFLGGSVVAPISPYWTTGFYWLPSWSADVTHNMAVINTQLGENYSQRMNTAINSNSLAWNLVFAERPDKEASSLLNFLQNYGGATPFKLAFPVGNLYPRADLKYISQAAKHQLTSFGLNAITVPITQVFDVS